MTQPNEITIRVASPLLYIDDDSLSPEIQGPSSRQNLTIVRRSPRERSPEAMAHSKEEIKDPRFELTIRGENTVISIQSVAKPKHDKQTLDNEELYELINQTVQEIFKAPGREEIQKAIETVGFKEERKFTKKGAWQMLSRSAKAYERESSRDREERYPSIVMLQDPEEEEDCKNALLGAEQIERPKFGFRSKSMMTLQNPTGSCPSLNDLNLERHTIQVERSFLEEEKRNLAKERAGLEKGKDKLEEEKRSLERSKSFFIQDKNILKEKKQVLSEEKKENQPSGHIFNKEKLCFELEKQLIADERKLLTDEKSIINREKDIIRKERNILGGEQGVLEDEKVILGKEKAVLEKQHSIVEESFFKHNAEPSFSEMDDVFRENCQQGYMGHPHFRPAIQQQNPHCFNHSCGFNSTYPTYVPVYSYPRPYLSSYRPCYTSTLKKSKTIQTQTDQEPPAIDSSEDISGLPFGLLSGIFPRVVITSMGSHMPHGAEERADNARNAGIIKEIPPESPPKQDQSKRKPKTNKKLTSRVQQQQPKRLTAKSLAPPNPDVTLKAVSGGPVRCKTSDKIEEPETEAEESGIQTLTSETIIKDDTSGVSDETISVETIHYGLADDFYSNYALFPDKFSAKKGKEVVVDNDKPLTNTGYDIYKKLTELSLEQDEPKVQNKSAETTMAERKENHINLNINLSLNGGNLQVRIPNRSNETENEENVSIHIGPVSANFQTMGSSSEVLPSTSLSATDGGGKIVVQQADLWHSSTSASAKGKPLTTFSFPQRDVSVQLPQGGPAMKFNLDSTDGKSFNISQKNDSYSFDFGGRQRSEVSVGTDDLIAGGNCQVKHVNRHQLSPRTDYLLDALRHKLENAEMEQRIVSYGRSKCENPFDGFFLVKPLHGERPKPTMGRRAIKASPKGDIKPREYLCEECLTTMRLYEGDFQSVQDIVDKFEHMSKYGCTKF